MHLIIHENANFGIAQDAIDAHYEISRKKRLGDEMRSLNAWRDIGNLICPEARHEQNVDLGMMLLEAFRQFRTRHSRHHYIKYREMNRPLPPQAGI